jgi:hypothetical protein
MDLDALDALVDRHGASLTAAAARALEVGAALDDVVVVVFHPSFGSYARMQAQFPELVRWPLGPDGFAVVTDRASCVGFLETQGLERAASRVNERPCAGEFWVVTFAAIAGDPHNVASRALALACARRSGAAGRPS